MNEIHKGQSNEVPQLKYISYEDKLEFYRNVRQWHNKFIYQQFDLSGLKGIHLDKNEKFNILKEQLTSFNKQLQQAEISKITPQNFPSRYNFHSQILQLLREAQLSTNKEQQEEFIQKIYDWNNQEQIRSLKSRCKHTQSVDYKYESSNFDGTTNDETKRHFLDFSEQKQLPSQIIQENIRDFKQQQRTIHKEIDPPDVRLQQYSRKTLIQQQLQISQLKPESQSSFFPTQNNINKFSVYEEQEQQEKDTENEENKMPIEPIKVFLKDDQDLSIQRQQSKSFEVKQMYQQYQPSNSEIEASLQQRWITNRQKEYKNQKEDQELVNSMLKWSKNKSRIQKEMDRRQDSSQFGSRYQQLDLIPDSPLQTKKQYYIGYDPKVINLKQLPIIVNTSKNNSVRTMIEMDESISKQKIETTKKKYTSLLNLSNIEITPIKQQQQQQSLSIYGLNDQKNRSISQKNKMASVIDAFSPEKVSEEQLKEVYEIKNRMAKHKIVIPLKKIMTGLIAPTVDKNNLYDKIPDIGSMIMSNPFEVAKKTKKKKKKKKE
ncbi:unnamed protein product [Paramecium primaurelia]|uniref:Uncharacterized protein n=1 Tax=Paramecium primaurelia TaxID=5886 RepID=A0A8S1JQR8_PARPR|nr:unnamed protein product [Paramecium primaurelia]